MRALGAVPVSFVSVFLLIASSHALSSRTLLAPTGTRSQEAFGVSVASAGDFNGDGHVDVIVGACGNHAGGVDTGWAYLFHGGPGADAVADLVLTGEGGGDGFGRYVGSAGDLNADGYDDVIVGAFGNDAAGADAGRAYVFLGGPFADATPDLTLTGEAAGDWFGFPVAPAGDVNADGYDDVLVGAPNNDGGGPESGRAYVFYGGPWADELADLVFTGAAAGDRFGQSAAGAGDFNGDGHADVIIGAPGQDGGGTDVGRAYVFYGGVDPDGAADLWFSGWASWDWFGGSVACAGDVNGDGYDDLIVGAPGYDGAGSEAGVAVVYYGGPHPDSSADLGFHGGAAGDYFGNAVAGAGDVNGDGYDDVIAGAHGNDAGGTNAGRAYVYLGGMLPDGTADLTMTGAAAGDYFGYPVATAADLNADGYDDVIVGAYGNDFAGPDAGRIHVVTVRPYEIVAPDGGEQWVAGRPATVRWLGHGVADLAISYDGGSSWTALAATVGGAEDNTFALTSPSIDTRFAKVRVSEAGVPVTHATSDVSDGVFRIVLPESPPAVASRLGRTFAGSEPGDWFGYSASGAGDVNGDGYADVIVGAARHDAAGFDAGQAYVYYQGPGADATADLTLGGEAPGDYFGHSVDGAGDVNGDGYADVIVGAYHNDAAGPDAGRAYVYFGGPGADAVADLVLTGDAGHDDFGTSVGGAGDVNGDGFADVIVGAIQADTGTGRAHVYFGGPAPDASPDLTLAGESIDDRFGVCVSGAGDVNGDGYADVIVGAIQNSAGGYWAGRAYVYHGGPAADAVADLTLTGEAVHDFFGHSVDAAGDFNGDGYGDVVAGAVENGAGGHWAGRAYVYFGGPAADGIADVTMTGEAAENRFGARVGGAGDVNRDGYADVIVAAYWNGAGGDRSGRAYVYFGGPSADAVADVVLTGAGPHDLFGHAAASAGDTNGDGYADVIVGSWPGEGGGLGAARVYDFNRYFLLSPNGGETWNVGATESISWLGTELADVWLTVNGGATYERIDAGVGGSPMNSIPWLVAHQPTRFAGIKVTPSRTSLSGGDRSDSLFTIEGSIALLAFSAAPAAGGDGAALLTWSTDPGPEDLAGYRVEKALPGFGPRTIDAPDWQVLVERTCETSCVDAQAAPGARYRLTAINGLGDEYVLGTTTFGSFAPLAARPLPYRGGELAISFATMGGLGGGVGPAGVTLHDVAGRRVRTIARGLYAAGYEHASWDGRDEAGERVASGVYFLRLESSGNARTLKLVVTR